MATGKRRSREEFVRTEEGIFNMQRSGRQQEKKKVLSQRFKKK